MSIADIATPPARLGPESNGMLLTSGEYDLIDDWDENFRYELVHGVLVVAPPPGAGERSPNDYLAYLLHLYQESDVAGASLDDTMAEQEIAIGENRRRADRAIWFGLGRAPRPLQDTPTIAVEFVSKSSRERHRDYFEKRKEYAAAGVKEYWIIDRFRREMTVFRGVAEEVVIPEAGEYESPLLPGFTLLLAKLLAKADRYREQDD